MSFRRALAAFSLAAACASPNGTIQVTVGGEGNALTQAPAVDTLLVEAVGHDGSRLTLKSGSPSDTSLDLGDVSQTSVASLELTGSSGSNAVVFGATPFVELGALDGATIPLFVQRKGQLARMPGTIADSRTAPHLAATERAIYYAGGNISGSTDPPPLGGYDRLFLTGFGTTCPGAAASSFALVQLTQPNSDGVSVYAWFIDASGVKVTCLAQDCVDYSSLVTLPTGTSWADFAGGSTVGGDDGAMYLVGPSAPSAALGTVLKIVGDANAKNFLGLDTFTFSTSTRQGAATAWAPGRGVFLYGGSATAPGVEIVAPTGAVTTSFAPDPTQGLAAIAYDQSKKMLVAGDAGPARQVDLSCSGSSCAPTPWGPPLGVPLTSPALFALGNDAFLIVGDDPTGTTRAFRLTESEATPEEIFFKIPRQGARAVQTDTGEVIILGGGSDVPESYFD